MGLFSRKKKSGDSNDGRRTPDAAPEQAEVESEQSAQPESDSSAPEEPTPQVNISFSAFQGVGAASGPEVLSPEEKKAQDERRAEAAKNGPHAFTRPPQAPQAQQPAPRELPFAPAAPPSNLETIKGMRDNTLLRDALAALPEQPTPPQLLGVARQMMQGHVFLRVVGDAREQLKAGGKATLTFGVAKRGDKNYMLVFSSGKALSEAVQADGNAQTSAVAQPVPLILKHMLDNNFDGIIVDNASGQHRILLPREVLERARSQADETLRVKTALAQPRDTDTPKKLVDILGQRPPLWVAVGPSPQDETKMGIAEARLANGTRLLQVYSHPLEVVAQGRSERAMPFGVEKIAKVLTDHPELGGVLIDPAGPLMTLTRDELAPIFPLADEAEDLGLSS